MVLTHAHHPFLNINRVVSHRHDKGRARAHFLHSGRFHFLSCGSKGQRGEERQRVQTQI